MINFNDYTCEIVKEWQSKYCVGSMMPNKFRQRASELFSFFWKNKEKIPTSKKIFETSKQIYRILSLNDNYKIKIKNNNFLYYSFSNDLKGIYNVAAKDRYLRSDIFLLVCKPNQALNFKNFLDDLFIIDNKKNRYYNENEVVSLLTKKTY